MFSGALRRDVGVAAVLASALCGCTVGTAQTPSAVRSSEHSTTVLILPLENTGHNAQVDWLGEGLAELAGEQLSAAGLSVFSRDDRLAILEKLGVPVYAKLSRATMLKIGAEIDADYVIFGDFAPDGGNLRINARVLGINPVRLAVPVAESGAMTSFGDVETRIAARELCQISSGLAGGSSCDTVTDGMRAPLRSAHIARPDAFEFFIRGVITSDDESRLRFLRQASQLEPDWDQPLFALGDYYYAKRDCEPTQLWLSRIPADSRHTDEANFDLGVCALIRNDPPKAESVFLALSARPHVSAPSSAKNARSREQQPEVLSNLGAALVRQARYREALNYFETALKIDPGESDYSFNAALADYLLADWASAARHLREALHLLPDDPTVKALLAAALDKTGQSQEATALRSQPVANGGTTTTMRRDVTKMDATALSRLVRIHADYGGGAGK